MAVVKCEVHLVEVLHEHIVGERWAGGHRLRTVRHGSDEVTMLR